MKRLTALILTLALLLSSCGSASTQTGEPLDSLSNSTIKAETRVCDIPSDLRRSMLHLLDDKIPVEGTDNLFEVPCPDLAQLKFPTLAAYGEDLLFYTHDYDDNGSFMQLCTVNHYTGTSRISEPYQTSGFFQPQILNEHIFLCDPDVGHIRTLTQTLDVEQEFSLDSGSGIWYLSPDQNTLYQLDWDGSISTIDLQAPSKTQVIETLSHHNYYEPDNERVPFSCADTETQRSALGYLDLATGTIEKMPISSSFLDLDVSGKYWFSANYNHTAPVYLSDGTTTKVITSDTKDSFYLVEPGMLLKLNEDHSQLSLYDTVGTLLSTCTLPQTGSYDTPSLVWSPSYGGYFLLCNDEDGHGTLLFWNTSAKTEGDALSMCSYEEYLNAPAGTLLDSSLYARAKELGDQYGVEICIADQCKTEHSGFTASQVTDPDDISAALDLLEGVLSKYPDGFFQQLCYDSIQQVQLSLMTDLVPGDGYQGSYNGFAYRSDDEYQIVVDIYSITDSTYYHEFSHIIDSRLDWDSGFRPDALFSEEHWASLSPESFSYTHSYDSARPNIYGNGLDSYFIDDYSCTFPTEDRARIMETAMGEDGAWIFSEHEPLREKLDYYSKCIRDCFDTTGWPETTSWEAYLHTS